MQAVRRIQADNLRIAETPTRNRFSWMHVELGTIRKARVAEYPPGPARLGVHGEGPAFAVTETLVLVARDIAVLRGAHGQQSGAQARAGVTVRGTIIQAGPDGRRSNPLDVEGRKDGEVQPVVAEEDLPHLLHLLFKAGHGEGGKVFWNDLVSWIFDRSRNLAPGPPVGRHQRSGRFPGGIVKGGIHPVLHEVRGFCRFGVGVEENRGTVRYFDHSEESCRGCFRIVCLNRNHVPA